MTMRANLARKILLEAAELVAGDRERAYGDKLESHANIAALFNGYLGGRLLPGRALTARDVALMMVLLKVARTMTGEHHPDNYVDMAGYAGVAGQIADLMAAAGDERNGFVPAGASRN